MVGQRVRREDRDVHFLRTRTEHRPAAPLAARAPLVRCSSRRSFCNERPRASQVIRSVAGFLHTSHTIAVCSSTWVPSPAGAETAHTRAIPGAGGTAARRGGPEM